MPAAVRSAALALALAAALPARAGAADRPWYAPDHAKLQLAGNIGFLSPGLGYAWRPWLDGDLFLGWVPERIGGDDIFSVTGKLTAAPWSLAAGDEWRLRPLTAAFQLTYTLGDEYVLIPDEAFPPSALRTGLALGADLSRRVGTRTAGVYAELVALDVGLGYWLSDQPAVDPVDVFSLALGARVTF